MADYGWRCPVCHKMSSAYKNPEDSQQDYNIHMRTHEMIYRAQENLKALDRAISKFRKETR